MNNLKVKVGDLDFGKLRAVFIDFKKISDVVNKKVFKSTKLNKVNSKLYSLENKIFDATSLFT